MKLFVSLCIKMWKIRKFSSFFPVSAASEIRLNFSCAAASEICPQYFSCVPCQEAHEGAAVPVPRLRRPLSRPHVREEACPPLTRSGRLSCSLWRVQGHRESIRWLQFVEIGRKD